MSDSRTPLAAASCSASRTTRTPLRSTSAFPPALPDQLRKRLPQLTVNVAVEVRKKAAANGGEFVEIRVFRSEHGIASTTDGRYFLRVADETKRLLPDELGRLWNDRSSFVWELQVAGVPASKADAAQRKAFCARIRASDRVSAFVKAKSDAELLEHYLLAQDGKLTNLGVLWIGRRADRAALQHAPVLQCIKYDEREAKVRKWLWDDYSLNPLELIEALWREVPDWQESYELPAGLFRKNVPHYEEVVVRELLANALAHRPYTTRGDLFVNLYPDRLEVHNPGVLPLGVTPANILHTSNQRNPHLARVMYDLKLMEREGSGYDRIYQALLTSGRQLPDVAEGNDRVVVTVRKRIVRPEVIDFMGRVERDLQPTSKEVIVLGVLAQHESLTGSALARELGLEGASEARTWLGRLRAWKLVEEHGRTKAMEYRVSPAVLRKAGFRGATSLKRIEDHRLRELIVQDLRIYEPATRPEIHVRIGPEIGEARLRRALQQLVAEGLLLVEGNRRWRRYLLAKPPSNKPEIAQ